ncbi:MAG: MarC family protein [Candidatus Tectimicrobiota bacterium]
MEEGLLHYGLTSLVTLFMVVDPLGVAPLSVAITQGQPVAERRVTLNRAVAIAFGVALFFLLVGRWLLSMLGVSVHAFAISGGILLFATALPMLFGQRPGLQAPERAESPTAGESLAIFPLAIPLLSGPGTLATLLLLVDRARDEVDRVALLIGVTAVVYGLAWLILRVGERIMRRLGQGKVHVLTRVLGIVLAALAVQYVLNGVTQYYQSLLPLKN